MVPNSLGPVIVAGTIDVAAASARGIYVSNCPGKNAIAVAELAFALLLAIDRRVLRQVAGQRLGNLAREEAGVRVGEPVHLRMYRGQYIRMTVAQAGHRGAARRV